MRRKQKLEAFGVAFLGGNVNRSIVMMMMSSRQGCLTVTSTDVDNCETF